MERNCDKYNEKLSAYMDGQLPPDEMAEIAAHLEQCSACSELLEKMKRLDNLAAGTEPEFDDALMDELTDRITAGLESIEDTGEEKPARKPKIIPMWYKYVAVAASIAVVFFAGRMAFKETGIDISNRAPSQPDILMPSTKVEMDRIPETPKDKAESTSDEDPGQAQKKGVDQEKSQARKEAELYELKKATSPKAVTVPVADEEQVLPDDFVAEHLEVSPPPAGASIFGKVVDRETGRPIEGVKVQLKGARQMAMSGAYGDFEITAVPSDTYDLIYSSDGYETTKVENFAIIGDDVAIGDVEMKQMIMADLESEETIPITIDSLEALYLAATSVMSVSNYKEDRVTYQSASKSSAHLNKVKTLLDSLEAVPASKNTYWRLENLYIRARANYDMYLQTGDKEQLKQAGEFKNELRSMINQLLEKDEENSILLEYQSEIDQWRF
jgi:hypothetical protein